MNFTYQNAGVDIEKGDLASKIAYKNAKKTFASRDNKIGSSFYLEDGFSGVLDFGDFLLLQNDDGVGTKIELAHSVKKFDTVGADLLCMVVDDAVCLGAEVVSVTNTIDTPKIETETIDALTQGLAQVAQKEQIIIPGGEIAEMKTSLKHLVWNATAVGIVKKDRLITGSDIKKGDHIIGLKGNVLRSNGFSLVQNICQKKLGEDWASQLWADQTSWGEILLTPSKIFHRTLLDTLLGNFEDETRPYPVKGIVHITGGGIPGNIGRILPKHLTADFHNLHSPHQAVKDLQKMGDLSDSECYKTWHCGSAMMIISDPAHSQEICQALNQYDPTIEAQVVGSVEEGSEVSLVSRFSEEKITFAA